MPSYPNLGAIVPQIIKFKGSFPPGSRDLGAHDDPSSVTPRLGTCPLFFLCRSGDGRGLGLQDFGLVGLGLGINLSLSLIGSGDMMAVVLGVE